VTTSEKSAMHLPWLVLREFTETQSTWNQTNDWTKSGCCGD